MIIIDFKDGTDWYRPNWMYRQLCDDIRARYPDEVGLLQEMDNSAAYGHLNLPALDPAMSSMIMTAMKTVAMEADARGWTNRKISHPEDLAGEDTYLSSLRSLAELIQRQVSPIDS